MKEQFHYALIVKKEHVEIICAKFYAQNIESAQKIARAFVRTTVASSKKEFFAYKREMFSLKTI